MKTIAGLLVSVVVLGTCVWGQSPSPDRYEAEIRKFEAEDAKSPPPKDGMVFVGSSSIRLWKTKDAFPDLPVINRGFGGSHVADCVHFASRIVTNYKPRLVVFYAGDNDIAAGKKAEQVAADFEHFTAAVRKELPATRIIFVAIKPSVARWKLWPVQQDANRRIAEFCTNHRAMDFLDVTPSMLGKDGMPRAELFQKDGLHLNEEGYRVWNELLRPYLQKK